jgi:hypothetical protein
MLFLNDGFDRIEGVGKNAKQWLNDIRMYTVGGLHGLHFKSCGLSRLQREQKGCQLNQSSSFLIKEIISCMKMLNLLFAIEMTKSICCKVWVRREQMG